MPFDYVTSIVDEGLRSPIHAVDSVAESGADSSTICSSPAHKLNVKNIRGFQDVRCVIRLFEQAAIALAAVQCPLLICGVGSLSELHDPRDRYEALGSKVFARSLPGYGGLVTNSWTDVESVLTLLSTT